MTSSAWCISVDDWSEIKSTAYHEAGHLVAAAILGMPLCEGGMRIDLRGGGVSRYCIRMPGCLSCSSEDNLERQKTIISLLSGQIAQRKYLPNLDEPSCWLEDDRLIEELVNELTIESSDEIRAELSCAAEDLLDENWSLVIGLALLLWNQPITPMTEEEFVTGWSKSPDRREKFLSTSDVRNYFLTNRIECKVS